jgi:hypothetical protein
MKPIISLPESRARIFLNENRIRNKTPLTNWQSITSFRTEFCLKNRALGESPHIKTTGKPAALKHEIKSTVFISERI